MKKICIDLDCPVYVFGSSSENCPVCGGTGKKMTHPQEDAFLEVYQSVRSS